MLVRITLMRRHGLRLRSEELSEPLAGTLQLRDWTTGNSFGRAVRVLELLETVGTIQRPALSLFEPDLVAIRDGCMVYRGIELHSVDGRVYEHEQIWRVAPAT